MQNIQGAVASMLLNIVKVIGVIIGVILLIAITVTTVLFYLGQW